MDFTAELAIIDKYVEIKDVGNGEPLIVELITKYFLPGNRFEEARSWRNALKSKDLKSQMDKEIKEAVKNGTTVSISRMPQNTEWFETSPDGEAKKTDDQQYHYDRTVSYLNENQDMNLSQIQELIKFVSKSGVSEVAIEQKDFKITIKAQEAKGKVQEVIQVMAPAAAPVAIPAALHFLNPPIT